MMSIKNPYFELHKEFKAAGANVLMSSGQACVLFGIAAFSKDGDWIIEETKESCNVVLDVLNEKGASYRIGCPLDVRWLSEAWTSHFEYFLENGFRMRIDFCSRPPRINDINLLWSKSIHKKDIDVIDIESLLLLKQTRRIRDYSIIGAIAEILGYNQNIAEIAIEYLQDYELLKRSVDKWPALARKSDRKPVKLILRQAPRKKVVAELAVEQDNKIQIDNIRVRTILESTKDFQKRFHNIKKKWHKGRSPLLLQHEMLTDISLPLLKKGLHDRL